ncbi:unnamed protein product [Lactuca saligna]|uniref:Apple domain-containing protein n=1 Tax=Lactuca saligna TaxID=75948 RepID=A0AA35YCH8_LACSI|nr:unnamed protein product [Lactuca saligna]
MQQVKRIRENGRIETNILLEQKHPSSWDETGHRWSLTSWRSHELPADGSFRFTTDPNGTGQIVILRPGNIHWRSGSWKNRGFQNTALQNFCPDVRLYYISNETEQSFMYLTKTYDSSPALRMHLGGQLKASALSVYIQCHSGSTYNTGVGCAEYEFEELSCRKGYYFERRIGNVYIYGDVYEYDESYNLTSYDCQRICWSNCSCIAYTYGTTNRSECKTYGKRIYNPTHAENYPFRVYYTIVYERGVWKI